MCSCDKPTINGEMGYKWQPNDNPHIRPVSPPAVEEDQTILFDEPGRCGGLDSHSFHFRIAKDKHGAIYFHVRHGLGDEHIYLGCTAKLIVSTLERMESNERYWILCTLYHAYADSRMEARNKEEFRWQKAAAEKRIKTRKMPSQGFVKVWIEPTKQATV